MKVFHIKTEHGVEVYDMATGQLLSIQENDRSPPQDLFTEHEIDGQKVLIQNTVKYMPTHKRYNPVLGDIIAQKIIEGVAMSEICKEPGMPSLYLIARWRKIYPDFDEAINFARRVRAEMLRDEALSTAREAKSIDKDFIAGQKLAVDTLKWAAEKDDPDSYGSKTKVEGGVGVVHFIVDTGIDRSLQAEGVVVSKESDEHRVVDKRVISDVGIQCESVDDGVNGVEEDAEGG
jgi:hypothetical protein